MAPYKLWHSCICLCEALCTYEVYLPKKIGFYIISLLLFAGSFFIKADAQQFGVNELIDLSTYVPGKFDNYVRKKGFKLHSRDVLDDTLRQTYSYGKNKKDSSAVIFISKYQLKNAGPVSFQTSSLQESVRLNNQLKELGYVCSGDASKEEVPLLYQKTNITIRFFKEALDSVIFFTWFIERKSLPNATNIVFAEDLLCLNSHEYLVAVFGARNVVKDVFYLSETNKKNCSVIFPNTDRQAVFIWQDEINYRNISALRIGGSPLTEKSLQYSKPVEQNVWRTNQGIYQGISLKELERLNGSNINFADANPDNAASRVSKNDGRIDFKKIKLLLNCFNCHDKLYATNRNNSFSGANEDRKFFVSTIILFPGE